MPPPPLDAYSSAAGGHRQRPLYYIVAPPYKRTSAGTRVLHMLCDALNRRGHEAFILLYPSMPWRRNTMMPDLTTPRLTADMVKNHFEQGRTPIMVYPEIVSGNLFGSPCVVRYVLNFPGLLGGDKNYASDELCFSYSKVLAASTQAPDNILFIPATDTRIFRPAPEGQKREGSCFYAHKYKNAHKGRLFPITKHSIEITRDDRNAQTPREIADLFHHSEVFYCYENTALATEAVLCGCPAVFLPNPYLTEIIAAKELGHEGYAWGADPAAIAAARATVAAGAANYLKSYLVFDRQLDEFIEKTQKHAEGKAYRQPIRLPNWFDIVRYLTRKRGV
jgi:hypothetical protein